MSPRLKVSDLVIQGLSRLEEGSSGYLIGTSDSDFIFILGIVKEKESTDGDSNSSELSNCDILFNLPANVNFCGFFHVHSQGESNSSNVKLQKKINGTSVIINFDLKSKAITSCMYGGDETGRAEYTIVTNKDLQQSLLHFKLNASILLSCDFKAESVSEAFDSLQQKIAEGKASFRFLDSEIHILGNTLEDIIGISPESSVEKLCSAVKDSGEIKTKSVINVGLYLKSTYNGTSPQLAPLIQYIKKSYKHVTINLAVDSLACVPNQVKVKELHSILVESLTRNLVLNEKCLLSQLESNGIQNVSLPKTYHFLPSACGHFISIAYPVKQTPEQLKKYRENFHLQLALPMDKPLFRQSNAFDFSNQSETSPGGCILNPHEGVAKSGVVDGEPCLVQGTYAYHHYMQNNFDDNGWGCAYRSLQTIFSWFRFQGYTNQPVPTHREIQQCLVNIEDKPPTFVGSKQWIGSTEVSFVLDTILGVTCRIVSVSSGEELTMKGGELSYHFKTQGTPVMIGGGVLAHTILGVDYNKKTGAIKFLILDPHYTGPDDLKVIQSKGWCGWKGPEFWKKDAFYNMCLPLRPKCV